MLAFVTHRRCHEPRRDEYLIAVAIAPQRDSCSSIIRAMKAWSSESSFLSLSNFTWEGVETLMARKSRSSRYTDWAWRPKWPTLSEFDMESVEV